VKHASGKRKGLAMNALAMVAWKDALRRAAIAYFVMNITEAGQR